MQLAWSPSTSGKAVTAETIILADVADSIAFQNWLPAVKGRFVMISMQQPTGRDDKNLEEFATKESFEKMKVERSKASVDWRNRIGKTRLNPKNMALALEKAGAVGIIASNWSAGFGVNKIFSAQSTKIPTVDISLEDYGMLYRLTE